MAGLQKLAYFPTVLCIMIFFSIKCKEIEKEKKEKNEGKRKKKKKEKQGKELCVIF